MKLSVITNIIYGCYMGPIRENLLQFDFRNSNGGNLNLTQPFRENPNTTTYPRKYILSLLKIIQ